MDGVERAAILLMGIGEEKAAEVLKHLEPRHVQKVGISMTNMPAYTSEDIKGVMDDFINASQDSVSLGVNSEEFIKNILTSALGRDKAAGVIDRILDSTDEQGLATLKWMDPEGIYELIRNEHPQVVATILTCLDSEQAAVIVGLFPEEKRADLVLRMSSIESIKPEALTELGNLVQEQLLHKKSGQKATLGGLTCVADLINNLDPGVDTKVLEAIKGKNEALYEQIQDKMFLFENLTDLDSRSMQTLLRDVKNEVLMIALKGADQRVKDAIFTNMSKCAAELLKDDLDAQGPVKIIEVEAAQKDILTIARKLAEEGGISLGAKHGEEMI